MRPFTWIDTFARTLFPDRCHQWQLGPFGTDWRCLKYRKHDGDHLYEPDCWGDTDFTAIWAAVDHPRVHHNDGTES